MYEKNSLKLAFLCFFLALGFSVNAARINVPANTHVNIGNCRYKVSGWADVSIFPRHLNACDITLSGPCGDIHITALIAQNPQGEPMHDEAGNPIYQVHTYDAKTGDHIDDPTAGSFMIREINNNPDYYSQGTSAN